MSSKVLLMVFLLCLFTFKKVISLQNSRAEQNVKPASQNQQLETEMTDSNSDSSDDSVGDQIVRSKLHLYGSTVATKFKQSNPSSKDGNGRGVSRANSMIPKTDDDSETTMYKKQDKISYKSTAREENKPTTLKVRLKNRIPEEQEKYKSTTSENTEDNANNPTHEEGDDVNKPDDTSTDKPTSRIPSRPRYEDRFKEKTTSPRKAKYPKFAEADDDNTSPRMTSLTSDGNEQFSSMNPTRRPTSLTILTRSPLNSKSSLGDTKSTLAYKSNERKTMPAKPESYITTAYKQNERSRYTTNKPLVADITEDEDADADNNKAVTYKLHNVELKATKKNIPTTIDLNDCTTLKQETTPIYKIEEESKDNYKTIEANKPENDNDEEEYKLDKSYNENYRDEDKESEDKIKGDYRKITRIPVSYNPPENGDKIKREFSTKETKYSHTDSSIDPEAMELSNKFDQHYDDLDLKDKILPYIKPFRNDFVNDDYNNQKSKPKEEFSKTDSYKNEDRIGRRIDESVNDRSNDYYFSPDNKIKEIQKFYSYPKQEHFEKQHPESYRIDLQPFQVKKEYHVPNYGDSVTPKYSTYNPYAFRNSQPMYEYRQVHQ